MMADEKFHHSVYVILLDPVTLGLPSIVRFNPNRDPAKPCVYVGMTGLPVEQRFENHKKGVKAAWVVKKYGIQLMPELYEYLNPMPFEAAAQMEKDLAADFAKSRGVHCNRRDIALAPLESPLCRTNEELALLTKPEFRNENRRFRRFSEII